MQVQRAVNDILHDHFEIPHSKLVPETNLYSDLELDSLDAVDLLALLEVQSGLTIMPASFMEARTLGDVYQIVGSLVDSANGQSEIDDEMVSHR